MCFGSRRANLGMPGDLVIQERLVALKSADFLGTKVRAFNVKSLNVVRDVCCYYSQMLLNDAP